MEIYLNKYTTASLTAIIAILLLLGAVMATQTTDTAATTATVTVDEWLSVTLTDVPVTFGSMDPGTTANATVGVGFPATATIGAETNVVSIFIKTRADSATFTDGVNTFAVSNMEWNTTSVFPGTDYTTSDATVCSGLGASDTCNIYHQLTIPGAQAAGSYSTGITITATQTA